MMTARLNPGFRRNRLYQHNDRLVSPVPIPCGAGRPSLKARLAPMQQELCVQDRIANPPPCPPSARADDAFDAGGAALAIVPQICPNSSSCPAVVACQSKPAA